MKVRLTNAQLDLVEDMLRNEQQRAEADHQQADWAASIGRIRVRLSFAREGERDARLDDGQRSDLERVIREAIEQEVHLAVNTQDYRDLYDIPDREGHLATNARDYHDLYDILDRVVGYST